MSIRRHHAPRRGYLIVPWLFVLLLAGPLLAQTPPDPTPPPTGSPVPHDKPWYQELSLNGFVSSSVVVNVNAPASRTNQYRVFDVDDRSFTLDVVELVVQRAVSSPERIGFRVDVTFGSSVSKVTAAAGLFRDEEGKAGDFDVHQAYLSYIAPVGKGLRFDAGKFITHIGYEVIDGYDGYNDNHSRSLLFGYAEPVTHTGLRLTYPFSDKVSGQFYLVNGWDNARDNNRGKSFGGQLALSPSPQVSITANYLGGPEQADNDVDLRHLLDVVAIFKPTPVVTLTAT
jgi:hypothetical protein